MNELKIPLSKRVHSSRSSSGSEAPIRVRTRMDALISQFRSWNPYENKVFMGHTKPVWACAMTSDNKKVFSGSEDLLVKIWDMATQAFEGDLVGHTKTVNGLEVTMDDKFLISGDWDGKIFVWNWANKERVASLEGHTSGVYVFSMSSDGKHLFSGSGDCTAIKWNIGSWTMDYKYSFEGLTVFGVALTSDCKELVVCGSKGRFNIINAINQAEIGKYSAGSQILQCVVLTRDDRFVIFETRENWIRVWDYKDKNEVHIFKSHQNWVRNIQVSPDPKYFVSVSADRTIRIFNIEQKKEEMKLEGSEGYVFGEYFSKDGQYLLTGASDNHLRAWKIGKLQRVKTLKNAHEGGWIVGIAISSDNKWLATASQNKTAKIWNLETVEEYAKLEGHSGVLWTVTFSYDNKYVITGSGDNSAIVWDFKEKCIVSTLQGHTAQIFSVAASRNNKFIVTASQDKNLGVWDMSNKTNLAMLKGHTDTIFSVKITADSQFAITGSCDYSVRTWNLLKLEAFERIETKTNMIESVSLSPDEKYMIIGDRGNDVHLWNFAEKVSIKTFKKHTNWIKSTNFSSDGKYFVTASNDKDIRVWNASEERHEFLLRGHSLSVKAVTFTNDDQHVISCGDDSNIKIWSVKGISDLELTDITGCLDSFIYLSKIYTKKEPDLENYQSTFGNLKINLAHFYAYLGYDDLLSKALNLGTEIKLDDEMHSPLFYALERNSQGCVDIILKYMIDLSKLNLPMFLNYAHALRNDFVNLLKNRSVELPKFLDTIFYIVPNTTNFAVPKGNLPILRFSDSEKLEIDFFVNTAIEDSTKELPIEFKTLPFGIKSTMGSSGSIDLMESIINCPNSQILQTEFITTLVRDKWNEVWWYVFLMTVILWLNLIIMTVLIIFQKPNEAGWQGSQFPLVIVYCVLNLLLGLYESVQLFTSGFSYFTDIWNLIDVVRLSFCFIWATLSLYFAQNDIYIITWVMVVLNFYRGLTGFRAFDQTRFYIRLIFRAFNESIYFIMIFFYSTFAFGVIFYCSSSHLSGGTPETIAHYIWKSPYELNMGNFGDEYSNSKLTYVYFMAATVINVIIMLNLLISILGDCFDSFQVEAQEIDCLEMAGLVIEIENLMFNKRKMNQNKYFQVCKELEVEGVRDWEGKMKAISFQIEKIGLNVNTQFLLLNQKIDKLMAAKS